MKHPGLRLEYTFRTELKAGLNDFSQPNRTEKWIRIYYTKISEPIYELSTLGLDYDPNWTEIQTRIRKYLKLVKYVNIFIYIKLI